MKDKEIRVKKCFRCLLTSHINKENQTIMVVANSFGEAADIAGYITREWDYYQTYEVSSVTFVENVVFKQSF